MTLYFLPGGLVPPGGNGLFRLATGLCFSETTCFGNQ